MKFLIWFCILLFLGSCSLQVKPATPATLLPPGILATSTSGLETSKASLPPEAPVQTQISTQAPPPQPTQGLISTITASGPVIAVSFDGQTCTMSGPGQLPAGSLVIRFENLSGKPASAWLDRRYPDKTWQDVIELIGTPGVEEIEIPPWIALMMFRSTVNESSMVNYDLYDVTFPAEYDIIVEVPDDRIWPCGTFEVVAEP